MKNKRMPVLFIGHGSPMNAIQDNDYTSALKTAAGNIPRPEAVLVVSAHWQTKGTRVTSGIRPEQIYDFYGFPEELYTVRYQPEGAPHIAQMVIDTAGHTVITPDDDRGIDHAAWAVLVHLFPEQDIPLLELSLDISATAEIHYRIGSELISLRERGILVIGSGNIVHNLVVMDEYPWSKPKEWAVEFDERVRDNLINNRYVDLIEYEKWGKISKYAVPTDEHYIPMLYALSMRQDHDNFEFIHSSFQHGTISMRSFIIY